MTLAHDIAAELPTLRGYAEQLMVDSCTITRAGDPVFDPDTGTYTDPAPTTVYEGKCRIQLSDALFPQTREVGGGLVTVQRLTVQLPVAGTDAVAVGDTVEVTSAVNDPALVGKRYRITGSHAKTHATTRRLAVEETA